MKRLILSAMIAILSILSVKAQSHFEIGVFIGSTVHKVNNDAGGNMGGNFIYYYEIIEKLKVGGAVGFDYNSSDNNYQVDVGFVTIAASSKYNFVKSWFGALDLGFAVPVETGITGGFYFKPKAGWSTRITDLYLYYKNIEGATVTSDYDATNAYYMGSLGAIGLGLNFKF